MRNSNEEYDAHLRSTENKVCYWQNAVFACISSIVSVIDAIPINDRLLTFAGHAGDTINTGLDWLLPRSFLSQSLRQRKTHIFDLPTEILLQIFHFLPEEDLLMAAEATELFETIIYHPQNRLLPMPQPERATTLRRIRELLRARNGIYYVNSEVEVKCNVAESLVQLIQENQSQINAQLQMLGQPFIEKNHLDDLYSLLERFSFLAKNHGGYMIVNKAAKEISELANLIQKIIAGVGGILFFLNIRGVLDSSVWEYIEAILPDLDDPNYPTWRQFLDDYWDAHPNEALGTAYRGARQEAAKLGIVPSRITKSMPQDRARFFFKICKYTALGLLIAQIIKSTANTIRNRYGIVRILNEIEDHYPAPTFTVAANQWQDNAPNRLPKAIVATGIRDGQIIKVNGQSYLASSDGRTQGSASELKFYVVPYVRDTEFSALLRRFRQATTMFYLMTLSTANGLAQLPHYGAQVVSTFTQMAYSMGNNTLITLARALNHMHEEYVRQQQEARRRQKFSNPNFLKGSLETNVKDLPDEMLELIFNFLEPDDLMMAGEADPRFKQIIHGRNLLPDPHHRTIAGVRERILATRNVYYVDPTVQFTQEHGELLIRIFAENLTRVNTYLASINLPLINEAELTAIYPVLQRFSFLIEQQGNYLLAYQARELIKNGTLMNASAVTACLIMVSGLIYEGLISSGTVMDETNMVGVGVILLGLPLQITGDIIGDRAVNHFGIEKAMSTIQRHMSIPRFTLAPIQWNDNQPNTIPDAIIAAGIYNGQIIMVNDIQYQVVQQGGKSAVASTDQNPQGLAFRAVPRLRGG